MSKKWTRKWHNTDKNEEKSYLFFCKTKNILRRNLSPSLQPTGKSATVSEIKQVKSQLKHL